MMADNYKNIAADLFRSARVIGFIIISVFLQNIAYAQDIAPTPAKSLDRTGNQQSLQKLATPKKSLAQSDERTIRKAIALARNGETGQALSLLQPIIDRRPHDKKLLGDYVVILGWAGKDQEALSMIQKMGLENARPYVIDSLAKSARNLRLFDQSVELYRQAIAKNPRNLQSHIGLAFALSDAGKPHEALESLAPLLEQHKDNIDLLFAKAYVHEAKGEKLQAFWVYEKILSLSPSRRDVRRLRILAISSLGVPGIALSLAEQHPGLLTGEDMERVKGDLAAAKVQWGKLSQASKTERFSETDEAIEMLDRSIRRLVEEDGNEATSPSVLRARFDRIEALRNRGRIKDVTGEYESLIRQGVSPPLYVLRTAGDAYLDLEQPDKAADIYRQALEMSPGNYDIQLSLFWATIELGDFNQAIKLIDKLSEEQPTWRINRVQGAPAIYRKNHEKLIADSTSALALALTDDLEGAQRRLEFLVNAAPFNHELRQRLGHIYLWRGWPRRALGEFNHILPVDPDLLDARLGKAYTLMDLREYPKTEEIIRDLTDLYPEHKRVGKLKTDWEIHNKPLLSINVGSGDASATDQETESLRFDTYLYSSPIDYNFRIFVRSFYEKSTIDKERMSNQREGLGIQYRGPGVAAHLEADVNKESKHDIDLSGRLDWDKDDHWKVGASFDTFSLDAPLRGILQDITAWSGGLDLAYRPHESENARLNVQRLEFSDDNIRLSGLIALERRIYNSPYFKIPVSIELYGSRNSETNRPYFNPEEDLSGTVTFDFRWLLWKQRSRSFEHNLAFTGGYYRQKHFDTKSVRSLRYEHDWNISDTLALVYGVVWNHRVYDGDPEKSNWSYLNLTWRF